MFHTELKKLVDNIYYFEENQLTTIALKGTFIALFRGDSSSVSRPILIHFSS